MFWLLLWIGWCFMGLVLDICAVPYATYMGRCLVCMRTFLYWILRFLVWALGFALIGVIMDCNVSLAACLFLLELFMSIAAIIVGFVSVAYGFLCGWRIECVGNLDSRELCLHLDWFGMGWCFCVVCRLFYLCRVYARVFFVVCLVLVVF